MHAIGKQPPRRAPIALGATLAAVSGAVDVLAFTSLGQAFASVITGNLVVAGAAVAESDPGTFSNAAVAVIAYAAGVALGAIELRKPVTPSARRLAPATVLYAAELLALVGLTVVWLSTGGIPTGASQYLALVAASSAMGLQSTAFRLVKLPGVTTTYFTGTLTGLLVGLVAGERLNIAAAVALVALFAGAVAAAVFLVHAATLAPLFPVLLLSVVLIVTVARNRAQESSAT